MEGARSVENIAIYEIRITGNNTTNKIHISKIEYLEPANLPNDSVNDNNFLTPPSQTSSVKSDVNDATVNDKENISSNINSHTPPNQTPSVKSDFVNPPFSEVCPEPCSSQLPSSYFRTRPEFPTPFKNAFYFSKKPQQNAKKRVTKKKPKKCPKKKRKKRPAKKNAEKIKTTIPKKLNGKKTKEVDQEQINQEQPQAEGTQIDKEQRPEKNSQKKNQKILQ
ncbi:hypothetical protein JTB14_015379 [Gonioctena quinquepunctata]|nr:hypothetical protein JTB14_015379 [Gonioctena quinquepunctata]